MNGNYNLYTGIQRAGTKMTEYIQCPRCLEEGKIAQKMGRYEDGGQYCHRCHYLVRGDKREDYKTIGLDERIIAIGEHDLSDRWITGSTNEFSPAALAYLYKYRITNEEIESFGIRFIESGEYCSRISRFAIENHLFFPIRNCKNDVVGFQTKCIDPNQKIKTLTSKYNGIYTTQPFLSAYEHRLIIVEGIIDAICCSRQDVYTYSVALLGSSIGETKMMSLMKNQCYANLIYLWMDNDSAGEKHRQKIASFFEAYRGSIVKHIRTEKDPKHYSQQEIEAFLK